MSPTDCIVPHVCLPVNLHVVLFCVFKISYLEKNGKGK
jgi:hypothetical protein